MKHILLAVLVLCVAGLASTGEAQGSKFSGYLAPNLRVIDKGEGNSSNIGFGMAFNRFTFSGEVDAGAIVKKVAWSVEADMSQTGDIVLQNAFVIPRFSDALSLRFGHVKKAFSREVLHPTGKLLTVDRSPASSNLKTLGYSDYNYGLELMLAHPRLRFTAGAYSGSPVDKDVPDQDPKLDFGARAVVNLTPCLEVGANAMMVGLIDPASASPHSEDAEVNSGMAFGFDLGLNRDIGNRNLQALVEFGTGDNTAAVQNPTDAFEDWDFDKFQYYTAKALFKLAPEFGVHFGYSVWDPNTDTDDDGSTVMTPGLTYFWSKTLRTQVEAQLVSYENENMDSLTHLVLQQVFLW
ncbi:hypothetical protein JXA88_03375 [Candidatus Fermentibacteria bacterium]|nr:hypothetical protein [Candidatus Fermentibacteria bacterium]